MATAPTTGINTPGHGGFNDQENNPDPSNNPNHPLPLPGQQPSGTVPLGSGTPTGTRPPGFAKLFTALLGHYEAAYFANCIAENIPPAPVSDSIIAMVETQTLTLLARYPQEFAL